MKDFVRMLMFKDSVITAIASWSIVCYAGILIYAICLLALN